MKLAMVRADGRSFLARVDGDRLVYLSGAFPGAPESVLDALRGGPEMLARLAAVSAEGRPGRPLAGATLEAPIRRPEKFLAIGLNYRPHVDEIVARGGEAPRHQIWFNKNVSCITGPNDPIYKPRYSDALDYEGEIGVVIGRRCKHVGRADALSVIAGYLIVNDVTCRDWQKKTSQWTLAKSFDTHGPTGPWLTTADEVPDPARLALRLTVNGELRQQLVGGEMVFDIAAQIAELSSVMTLEAGDLIATGTTSGAGFGFDPPRFLQPGDTVRIEVDGLGHLENRIVVEP